MSEELNRAQWERLYREVKAERDALLSQLREAQERAERAEAELVIANRVIARHLPSAVESVGRDAKLAASEQALRDAQGALQACSEFGCDECGDAGDTCLDRHPTEPNEWCQTCIALAALAPNTEGEGK